MIRGTISSREARTFRANGSALAPIICAAILLPALFAACVSGRARASGPVAAASPARAPGQNPAATMPAAPAATIEMHKASPVQILGERALDILELAMALVVAVATLAMGLLGARGFAREALESSRAWLDSVPSTIAALKDSVRKAEPTAVAPAAIKLRETLLVGAGAGCFAAAFSYPILGRLSRIGLVDDWAEHLQPDWAAFYSITHFHQLPLWSPYRCGGMPLLAHPLSLFVTPLVALQLIFGPFTGLNLQIPVHLAITWAGGYMLARRLGMDLLGRLTCASIFPASSWFYLHIAVGHLEYLPAAYLPWIVMLVWVGTEQESILPWIAAGLLIAITFGEGGAYQCTRAVFFASLLAIYSTVVRRNLRAIKGIVILGIFSIGFGAIKLLPCLFLMRLHPRPIADLEYNPVGVLLTSIFTRDQFWDRFAAGRPLAGGNWGFFELGSYLSPAAVGLAALGLWSRPRRSLPWLLAAALFFAMAIGSPAPWYPWALLHHLPLMSSERVPSRSLMAVTLPVGVIAGFGADVLARSWKPLGGILGSVLLGAAILDAWMVNRPNLDPIAESDPPAAFGEALSGARLDRLPPGASWSPQFRQFYGSPWEMVGTAISNMGSVFCNEGMDFSDLENRNVVGFNQPGYRGEQFLLRPGSVTLRRWTPNALGYDVNTPTANVMVVNQNYNPNWRLAEGDGEVFSEGGLIGVRLSAGTHHLELVYRSYPFLAGAALTLLTCVGALVVRGARLDRG